MKVKTWRIIESNPTVSTEIFIFGEYFNPNLVYLFCRFTSRLVCEISSQITRVPKSHEKNYKWNKIILFDSLCYTAKKGNIKASNISFKLSAFSSLRDACNEHHIFLPWLFLIPQRNLIGEDFDHVLGNHF